MLDWLDDLPEPEVLPSPGKWQQPSLFGAHPELPLAPGAKGRDYGLRWYQQEAKEAVEARLQTCRSTLAVMATGTGKTRLFGAVASDWDGNVLVLAHRDELVHQARRDLEAITGEVVEIEQADLTASLSARIVVGSTDTVKQQKRLDRFGKDRFQLVIPDEFHHYTARTYRRILDFFDRAKIFGVTATPDRGDRKALGQIADSVAYVFDIQQAIEQGYLVEVLAHEVTLGEIDVSGVGVSGGDLVAAQLDEVMLKACAGIVSETLRYEPDRQGIAYLPGVKSAELVAELFNRHTPGSCGFVSGATPKEERREMFRAFKEGQLKYISNCMVATEGTDLPTASLIIQGRPTKSRALHTQISGRGMRVLPGVVDHVHGRDGAEERRRLIAASAKPDCIILDFVGNSGKHKLVTAADVLGGKYTEDEVTEAKKKLKTGGNVQEALEAARRELNRIATAAKVKASSVRKQVDPFGAFNMVREHDPLLTAGYKAMTMGQRDFLLKAGVKEKELEGMSRADAQRLQGAITIRRSKGLASYAQMRTLKMVGVTQANVSYRKAKEVLDYVFPIWHAQRAGDKSRAVDPAVIESIVHRERVVGEEG